MTSLRLCSSALDSARPAGASRLIIIGNRGGTNIGESFERSAKALDCPAEILESKTAMGGPRWLRFAKWHFMQHTPAQLGRFSKAVVARCKEGKPTVLLTTGLAPVNESALREIGALGICRCNYLTDDPWNSSQCSPWFFKALAQYDYIFTPRRANMSDLRNISNAKVTFLPFGYDPELFFPVELDSTDQATFDSDVMFAGGADADRVPYIVALERAGMRVALYGSYWDRFPATRSLTRGQIGVAGLRKAIAGCRIALCIVRHANRDGHSMRTFEIPAIGACMLTEETAEHREIFGPEGEAVVYFSSILEMAEKARWLVDHENERNRLAVAAHERLVNGRNTYQDRLAAILL